MAATKTFLKKYWLPILCVSILVIIGIGLSQTALGPYLLLIAAGLFVLNLLIIA